MINKDELYPKEKQYLLVVVDLWDDLENSAYKLLETDELEQTVQQIKETLNVGEYLMVYDRNGQTIDI